MGRREVAYVNVVSHSGTIGRVIIGTKNFDGRVSALRCCDYERNEVRLRCVILANVAFRIGPSRIEIPQPYRAQTVSLSVRGQDLLPEQFRFAIWTHRALRMVLADWQLPRN